MIPGITAGVLSVPDTIGGGDDPFYDDVSSLLHFNGANGSTTFSDEKGVTWGATGNAHLTTAVKRFGTASASFDGSGDWLDATIAALAVGIDDYTMEMWGRFGSVVGNRVLWSFGGGGVDRQVYQFNSGTPTLAYHQTSADVITITGHVINTFYHVALCRAAGITRLFRNGVAGTDFTDNANLNGTQIRLGASLASASELLGNIDEFRLTRRARYTAGFAPPTAAFGNSRGPFIDPHYASVVALLNFEGANGQTWFLDERGSKWSRIGTPALTTAQTPGFGTSSLDDPAGNSYILTASKADFGYGTGDFTIEFFARPTNLTGIKVWYDQRTSLNQTRPSIYDSGGGNLRYFVSNADRITGGAGSVVINTWQHIAVSRSAGSTRMFVGGVQKGSTYTDATNYDASLIVLGQAGDQLASAFGFIGQYKGLRVTKGVGRYTANFTPPAALFSNT